ncbi:hypothetical protein [Roseobacter sp. N2S]|uniref:hypothetical protein n=1 Tax=Roseobacter sp. N2S TaxID=2663844 RepID=UPI00285FBEC8|nr:hypothetical protein [Roseobacter sp. N2S]MDR6266589.1 hypothetical protein [Roseobacter sp. N2S]
MSHIQISHHAARRFEQRGIPTMLIEQIVARHDQDHEIGDDCRALRLSCDAIVELAVEQGSAQLAERLTNLTVIWSDRNNQVVTAFRNGRAQKSRRYRGRV